MNRRQFVIGAGAAAAGAAGLGAQAPAKRPNILHLMVDQMQWGAIAGRTQCRTPNLNRLAAAGLLFNRSYTPSAVCCPARAMLISGAYHWHNGVYNQVHSSPSVSRSMFKDVVTYSARLKEAGYRLGYVGKWHADYLRTPLDFGFDEVSALNSCHPRLIKALDNNPDRIPPREGKLRQVVDRSMRWPGSEEFAMWGHVIGAEELTPAYHAAESGIRVMRRFAAGSQPWHLEIHWVEPHDAYMPLKQYLDRYNPDSIPVPESFRDTFRGKPGLHRRESESWGPVTEKDYREGRAHYYAYCEELDAQLGRVLEALEATGQADNTLVVFTCDHGDMVGAHRMWIKGWIPYEETYRIPQIMRWPARFRGGRTTDHLASSHDLGHTYLEAAGARPLPFADGRSLLPLCDDPAPAGWRDQLMCVYYGGEFMYTQRIAITARYKYVFNGFDIDEFYDLRKDPQEMHNGVDDAAYRADVDDLRARLYEMMKQFGDPYGDPSDNLSQVQRDGNAPNRYGAPRYLPRGKRKA